MKGLQRIISLCLTLCLLISMVPVEAFAQETEMVSAETAASVLEAPEADGEEAEETAPAEETAAAAEEDAAAPETTAEATAPEETVPETTEAAIAPEETAPETTVPTVEEPEQTVVEETVPATESEVFSEETLPEETIAEEEISADASNAAVQVCGDFKYVVLEDGSCQITGYTGTDTALEIPGTLDDYVVSSIGTQAFYNSKTLVSVVIPESVTHIGEYGFCYANALVSVVIPDSVTTIGSYAFYNCTALSDITIPDSVTTIGSTAFSYCTALSGITIPDSVASIGSSAFSNCTSLRQVIFGSGLTEIGTQAFSYCTALPSITIPDTVTALPSYLFSQCSSLTSVELPETLTAIGSCAFVSSGLTSIRIPESVTTLELRTFSQCKSLENVTLHGKLTAIGDEVFSGCTGLKGITIPEDLTVLGKAMFKDCTALESIVIPRSIPELPNNLFEGCSALAHVTLPDILTKIGGYAFQKCSSLEEVQLPESITSIGSYAFSRCTSLKSIKLPNSLTALSYSMFEYCKALETVVLPEQLKETAGNAFYYCEALTEVRLPEGLETISGGTFTYCTALETVGIPESVTTIEGAAFSYCKNLKEIQLPQGITELDNGTFAHCSSLEYIEIPESVTQVGEQAFYDCESLMTVTLPGGLQTIKSDAFMECDSLESIEIPDGVTTIPYGCFMNCGSLKRVKLPAGLEVIGQRAFRGCPLRAVNLPAGLTTIYDENFGAFKGDIVVPSSVTTFGSSTFGTNAVFYCDLRSAAAAYAIDHGIPIVERKDPALAAASRLDLDNSYFKAAVDGIGASGNMSFTGQYAFKSGTNVSDLCFEAELPAHLELEYDTLTLDGKKVTDFTLGGDDVLRIPLSSTSGVIRFQLRPTSYQKIAFYAAMRFNQNGAKRSEILGTVYELMPALSIDAASETSSPEVAVAGITIPGNTVTLLVDGVEKATATANRIGDYTAVVDLGDVRNGQRCTITAKTNNGGSTESAQKTVIYKTNIPMLEDLIIYHGGQKVALSEIQSSRPILVFDPNREFEYCVEIDNPELVDTIYIISRRGSEEKIIEAAWDEEEQAFVAGGRFDPNNESYVPGDLRVEYVPKPEPVNFAQGYNYTSREKFDALPENWKNADVTVNQNTDDKVDLSFSISEADGSKTSFRATAEKKEIPADLNVSNIESKGYIKAVDDAGNVQYARVIDEGRSFGLEIVDFTIKTVINCAISEVATRKTGELVSEAAGTATGFAFATAFLIGDHITDMSDANEVWSKIYNSDLSPSEQMDLMSILGVGVMLNAGATMFQAIALVGFAATAATCSLFAAPALAAATAVGIICGVAKLGIKQWTNRTLRARELHLRNKRMNVKLSPRWTIDPSGYVYDADTEVRIHGATVSVYWIPYDGTDEDYWDEKPASTVYGELWDASEFSQENPLKTDIEGRYAWDVPEGWWRVKVEHPDYRTAWSDWVPVPPPQTEVNIPMISKDTVCNKHEEMIVEGQEATCTEAGLTDGKKCSVCGEILVAQKTIAAKGHTEAVVPGKAATCTEAGLTDGKKCASCGTVTVAQQTIPAKGHTEVKVPGKAATCSATGLIEGKKCSVCGTVTVAQKTIPAKAHTYDDNVDGTCNVCSVNREAVEIRQVTHMFRMYNPNTGEHFYTGSEEEKGNLVAVGWQYEGVGFTFPANTGAPVHRLFEPATGEHLYTMNEAEKASLMENGWNYEGIAFNSAYDTEAVQHRLHNPNATVGAYHFTFSEEEMQNLIDVGWEYQGIGWYSCWK